MAGTGLDVAAFLAEPHRPASVATMTPRGRPALASMWFRFVDGRFWFHTPAPEGALPSPFLEAARTGASVAVMVETFDAAGRVIKVRATGPARLEAADFSAVRALYDRYLGPPVDKWSHGWEAQVADPTFRLWSMAADSGSAVEYPELQGAGGVVRWNGVEELAELCRRGASGASRS